MYTFEEIIFASIEEPGISPSSTLNVRDTLLSISVPGVGNTAVITFPVSLNKDGANVTVAVPFFIITV